MRIVAARHVRADAAVFCVDQLGLNEMVGGRRDQVIPQQSADAIERFGATDEGVLASEVVGVVVGDAASQASSAEPFCRGR